MFCNILTNGINLFVPQVTTTKHIKKPIADVTDKSLEQAVIFNNSFGSVFTIIMNLTIKLDILLKNCAIM